MRVAASWLLAALLVGAPARARADGAFPDSMGLFLPAGAPARIILGTNFGLLVSEDGGASWRWICEPVIASFVSLYQLGAPPAEAVYAITSDGLARSSADLCAWPLAEGSTGSILVGDAFPDPSDPTRVLSIARAATATAADTLFESTDGGRTLGRAIHVEPRGRHIESVEIPRSAPDVVFVTTTSTGSPKRPRVLRSTDRGRTFQSSADLEALGDRRASIAAVDPTDPAVLYLRVWRAPNEAGDQLGISRDGGQTATSVAGLTGPMSGFLRASDGALYVLSRSGSLRSTDGGATFTPWSGAMHLRALAERGGALYGVADDFMDGFAVGRSTDGGANWTPLLRFSEIRGLVECPHVQSVCSTAWTDLKSLFGIGVEPPAPSTPSSGCSSVGTPRGEGSPWLLLIAAGALTLRLSFPRGSRTRGG